MSVTPPTFRPPSPRVSLNRFITRAEAMTLLGMIVCVSSLFLAWPAKNNLVAAAAAAAAIHLDLTLRGQSIPEVRWPIFICAIACGATLLFSADAKSRTPIAVFQGLCGLVCFVTALTHFALLPGVIAGVIGGSLLTFGAIDRYNPAR